MTKAPVTSVFNGQSYIVVLDEVADYNTATVAEILKNGFDVGQVFEGSTSWTGEEPSFEDKLDEQGDVIVSSPQKGTYGFDFTMADFSAEKWKTFLKAKTLTVGEIDNGVFESVGAAVGVGAALPVLTRPIALVNDEGNRAILFPKGRIISGLTMDDKTFGVKSSVKAQDCDTANLGTCVLLDDVTLPA